MKILTDKKYRELKEQAEEGGLVGLAHIWLHEFDWFLSPLWTFLRDSDFSGLLMRDSMRRRLKSFVPGEGAPSPELILALEEVLKSAHYVISQPMPPWVMDKYMHMTQAIACLHVDVVKAHGLKKPRKEETAP